LNTPICNEFKLIKDEIVELLRIANNYKVMKIQNICSDLIQSISETENTDELVAQVLPEESLVDDFVHDESSAEDLVDGVGEGFEGNLSIYHTII